jgi:hypothetical protein
LLFHVLNHGVRHHQIEELIRIVDGQYRPA